MFFGGNIPFSFENSLAKIRWQLYSSRFSTEGSTSYSNLCSNSCANKFVYMYVNAMTITQHLLKNFRAYETQMNIRLSAKRNLQCIQNPPKTLNHCTTYVTVDYSFCVFLYYRLFYTVVYLYWSIMGLEAMDPLTLDNQATVIEGAAKAIYSFFYVLVIIVLLNALVAVMSNVYNEVEVRMDWALSLILFCN